MDTRRQLAAEADAIAVDGLEVRLLAGGMNGTMAHFRLPAGRRGGAVLHDELEELWYCVAGGGWLWMSDTDDRDVTPVRIGAGTSFCVPAGAAFQVENDGAPRRPLTPPACRRPVGPVTRHRRTVDVS